MEKLNSIYCQTYNFVYLRAKSVLKKEEDVQQLVKEVYLKLAAESVDDDHLYEWLAQQTYTLGCMRFRKKKVREAELIEWNPQGRITQKNINQKKTKEVICEVLDELPDMYQATLYAFYYDHMNLKEVAAVMGYSVGAIKNRLNYIHKYLEKALENYQEEHKVKVQFSVEIVCEALREWSEQNKLSLLVAQNIQTSLCKELDLEIESECREGETAGLGNRVRVCADEVQAICDELESYSVKKRMNKNHVLLMAGGGVLLVLAIVGVLLLGRGGKEESPKKTDENKIDISEDATQEEPQEEDAEETSEENTEQEDNEEGASEENIPQEEPADSEYILPTSDSVKLTRDDLQGLSKEQLRLARNEIFARHGMIFGVADLDNYFATKSWYKPSYTTSEFNSKVEMSMIEEANVSLILQVESELE